MWLATTPRCDGDANEAPTPHLGRRRRRWARSGVGILISCKVQPVCIPQGSAAALAEVLRNTGCIRGASTRRHGSPDGSGGRAHPKRAERSTQTEPASRRHAARRHLAWGLQERERGPRSKIGLSYALRTGAGMPHTTRRPTTSRPRRRVTARHTTPFGPIFWTAKIVSTAH